jgi:multidrug efflux pump subunit AcrA (membrane-fusion protein)
MLMRISLIVAIVAALAAGVVNVIFVKDKINTLVTDRNTQRDGRISAEGERDKTKKELTKTQNELTQTQTQLADSQAAEKKAEDTATAQAKRADEISDKLTKATQERDDAQTELASYTASGFTSEQVAKLGKTIKDAQNEIDAINAEKAVLEHKANSLQTRLNKYEGTNDVVTLRPDLKGKIVIVDPKWDFVVLDIGENQGVLQDGELLVSREGKLVAKVVVRTVEKDRSIANVVPGWKLGEVIEGDDVSPAHPAS